MEEKSGREPGTVRLFEIGGVPIFAHWSLLAGAALLSVLVRFDVTATFALWLSYVLLIVIHEAAHALAARSVGLKVLSVRISGVGGLCRFQNPTTYGAAFFVVSAGLLAQVLLLMSTVACIALVGAPDSTYGSYVALSFTYVNGFLILVNLIPEKSRRRHFGTDGYLLWKLLLNLLRKRPAGMPDTSATFPPETRLAGSNDFTPDGFKAGIEVLNDNTTPMEFVVNTLAAHLQASRDEAIKLMLSIHAKGGAVISLPTYEQALAVADGIARDASASGHKFVCRAVRV